MNKITIKGIIQKISPVLYDETGAPNQKIDVLVENTGPSLKKGSSQIITVVFLTFKETFGNLVKEGETIEINGSLLVRENRTEIIWESHTSNGQFYSL